MRFRPLGQIGQRVLRDHQFANQVHQAVDLRLIDLEASWAGIRVFGATAKLDRVRIVVGTTAKLDSFIRWNFAGVVFRSKTGAPRLFGLSSGDSTVGVRCARETGFWLDVFIRCKTCVQPCEQKRVVAGRQGVSKRSLNVCTGRCLAHCLAQIGQHCCNSREPACVPCGAIVEEKNLPLGGENPAEGGLIILRARVSQIWKR